MFSTVFQPSHIQRLRGCSSQPADVTRILDKASGNGLSLADSATLLQSPDSVHRQIIARAAALRTDSWGGKLFLMPPLYVSNGQRSEGGCLDSCLYCPWRNGNIPSSEVVRLTLDETTAEARHVLSMGYQDIELVAATDPLLRTGAGAAAYVRAAKLAGAQHIGLNFFPLPTVDDYRAVQDAGATFMIVWQETYDLDRYPRLHPRGPKADMAFRLDAHDRALQAGIQIAGVAFLGGLSDWRFDALATLWHAQYLRAQYGADVIFGMPRWKSSAALGMTKPVQPYTDDDYLFVGAVFSLTMPSAMPWFSTREDFDLSARAAQGGGCLFTLDCSTEVGGYTRAGTTTAQFPVFSRSFSDGVEWLARNGFSPNASLPWQRGARNTAL